jgi:hypothetical protein
MNDTNISSRGMLVDLRPSQWTARKTDKKAAKEVAATHQMVERQGSFYKSLIDTSALETVRDVVTGAREYHWKRTLPWSDTGPRVLACAAYFDYMEKISQYHALFDQAVNELLAAYPYHRQEAQRLLGTLFNDAEYPTTEALAAKFAFNVNVLPLPVAGDFRAELGDAQVEAIRKDIEANTRAAVADSMRDAFDRVAKLVERYATRLATPENTFRASMVEDSRDLADLLPKLNLTGDPQLDALAQRLVTELCPYEAEQLRSDPLARNAAYRAALSMKSDLASFFGV